MSVSTCLAMSGCATYSRLFPPVLESLCPHVRDCFLTYYGLFLRSHIGTSRFERETILYLHVLQCPDVPRIGDPFPTYYKLFFHTLGTLFLRIRVSLFERINKLRASKERQPRIYTSYNVWMRHVFETLSSHMRMSFLTRQGLFSYVLRCVSSYVYRNFALPKRDTPVGTHPAMSGCTTYWGPFSHVLQTLFSHVRDSLVTY